MGGKVRAGSIDTVGSDVPVIGGSRLKGGRCCAINMVYKSGKAGVSAQTRNPFPVIGGKGGVGGKCDVPTAAAIGPVKGDVITWTGCLNDTKTCGVGRAG